MSEKEANLLALHRLVFIGQGLKYKQLKELRKAGWIEEHPSVKMTELGRQHIEEAKAFEKLWRKARKINHV